jgi:adenine-specific DNA-methyltransferase
MSIGSDPRPLAGRPKHKARLLGQVVTPSHIAEYMAKVLLTNRPRGPISILDPAVGPGTFPMALLNSGLLKISDQLTLCDIDEQMITATKAYLRGQRIQYEAICTDYLELEQKLFNDMTIINPPYVRQEWIDKKPQYRSIFKKRYGLEIPGTSNLYVYFLVKALFELKPGGRLACIIYDSWRFTKFGNWLISLMASNCDSVETVPMSSQPFDNRLIDATVIFGQRSSGDSQRLWTTISHDGHPGQRIPIVSSRFKTIDELFRVNRGLRLKQVKFFLCDYNQGMRLGATDFTPELAHF